MLPIFVGNLLRVADMRLRINDLLKRRGLTPYALARASGGRVSLPMVYRLQRSQGRFTTIKADVLDGLCDVLDVEPGELFERERPTRRKARGA